MNWFIPPTKIIRNYAPLNVDKIPESVDEIVHRENELTVLRYHFASVFTNEAPRPLFIYGLSGSGKTLLTKVITQKLTVTANEENINVFCPYVNCANTKTAFAIYRDLAEQYATKTQHMVLNQANSTDQQLKNFITGLNMYEGISIIILDEIDKGDIQDVMYTLSRLMGNDMASKGVGIICISNNRSCAESFDPRTVSSLAKKELCLEQYNALELKDIIGKRAQLALVPGTYDNSILELCAALTAKRDGDARKAITLLHDAAETSQIKELSQITPEIVIECERRMRQELETMAFSTLPLQLKITLASTMYTLSTREGEKATFNDIYASYQQLCKQIDATPYKRRTFIELLQELDMQSYINISKTSGGRGRGVHSIVTPNANLQDVVAQIMQDDILHDLKDLFDPFEKYS